MTAHRLPRPLLVMFAALLISSLSCNKRRPHYLCEIDANYMLSAFNKISYRDKIKLAMGQEIFLEGAPALGPHDYDFQIDPVQQTVAIRNRNSPNPNYETALSFVGPYITYKKLDKQYLVYDQTLDVIEKQPRYDFLNFVQDDCREQKTGNRAPVSSYFSRRNDHVVNAHRYTSIENTWGFIEMIIDVDYPNTPDRPRLGDYLPESPLRFVSGGISGAYQEQPRTQYYFSSVGMVFPINMEIINVEDSGVGSHGIFARQRQTHGTWIIAFDNFNTSYYAGGAPQVPASGTVSWEFSSSPVPGTQLRWEFFGY